MTSVLAHGRKGSQRAYRFHLTPDLSVFVCPIVPWGNSIRPNASAEVAVSEDMDSLPAHVLLLFGMDVPTG